MKKLSEDVGGLHKLLNDKAANEQQIISEYPELIELAGRLHDALVAMSSNEEAIDAEPVPLVLVLQAHSYYLEALRIALGGNLPGVFPLLRAAIESVIFALIAHASAESSRIWLNRDKSSNAKDKCIKTFNFSAGLTILRELEPELADGFKFFYEASISHGAHPNSKSIKPHLLIQETDDGQQLLTMRYMHPAKSEAVFDALDAVIRMGSAIAAGVRHALPNFPAALDVSKIGHAVWDEMHCYSWTNGQAVRQARTR